MTFAGSKDRLVASLKLLPLVLTGKHPDALGLQDEFWGRVANAVLKLAQDDYEVKMVGGRGRDGRAWPPLSPATIAKRLRQGRTDDLMLIETERLIASLTPGAGADRSEDPDQINERIPGGVRVGSAVPWADAHQNGVPGKLPARPFLPPNGEIPAGWRKDFEAAVADALTACVARVVAAGGID